MSKSRPPSGRTASAPSRTRSSPASARASRAPIRDVVKVAGIAKRAGVVTGVAAGVAGALYAGERAVAARIRRGGPDDAGDDPLVPDVDEVMRIPTYDGGELYVIERGSGTPIVF